MKIHSALLAAINKRCRVSRESWYPGEYVVHENHTFYLVHKVVSPYVVTPSDVLAEDWKVLDNGRRPCACGEIPDNLYVTTEIKPYHFNVRAPCLCGHVINVGPVVWNSDDELYVYAEEAWNKHEH